MSEPPAPLFWDGVEVLRAVIERRPFALIFDVDGTLSPLAPTPKSAIVPQTTRQLLRILSRRVDLCAALSGRSARATRALVGVDEMLYVGNHGLDSWSCGEFSIRPEARPFVEAIEAALAHVQKCVSLPGVIFELKGATASIHYRMAAEPRAARLAILEALAPWAGQLRVTEGKFVVGIRPPVKFDKGDAVRSLVEEHHCRGVLYAGDDRTDVDAFRVVRQLGDAGVLGIAAAVVDEETPPDVWGAAHFALAGVDEVERLLVWLAEAVI